MLCAVMCGVWQIESAPTVLRSCILNDERRRKRIDDKGTKEGWGPNAKGQMGSGRVRDEDGDAERARENYCTCT